ncbi:hypothetical protein N9174_00435 [bacterium]|nr:hypothetical protein [bacterium]
MRSFLIPSLLIFLVATRAICVAYPLDGSDDTGIPRLEGYRLAQEGKVRGRRLPPGALLKTAQVDLRLLGYPDLSIPKPDPALTSQIIALFGKEADRYGFAVLDLSDIQHPRYAEHRGLTRHNPGSVGKLLVALGIFQALFKRALQDPVSRNGLDFEQLRQGSFFTWKGKQQVLGTTSYATPRELLRFLLRLEQGKIVDVFSSREIKRLIYVTRRRIRYASSPALSKAAVYFKSGSLYKCKPEPGFKCLKYRGNVTNLLNSVAIVEDPAAERSLFYMVVMTSNVLRKNSAVEHQTLATRLHRLIQAYHKEERSDRPARQ